MKQLEEHEKDVEESKLKKKIKTEKRKVRDISKIKEVTKMKSKPTKRNVKDVTGLHIKKRAKKSVSFDESSSSADDVSFVSDSSDDLIISDDSDEFGVSLLDPDMPSTSGVQPKLKLKPESRVLNENDFVAAVYDGQWFIASVLGISETGEKELKTKYIHLRFTETKGENKFTWPLKNDEIPVLEDDILCTVEPPIPVSSRHIGLMSNDYKNVKRLFLEYLQYKC